MPTPSAYPAPLQDIPFPAGCRGPAAAAGGKIKDFGGLTARIHWKPNDLVAHARLVQAARQMVRRAGYPIVLTQRMGIETNSHQCGTLRFGDDPARSVLDPFCRTHDVPNLYVVDSSFFPSSTAVNPVLTIAAQSLRVADHLIARGSATARSSSAA